MPKYLTVLCCGVCSSCNVMHVNWYFVGLAFTFQFLAHTSYHRSASCVMEVSRSASRLSSGGICNGKITAVYGV